MVGESSKLLKWSEFVKWKENEEYILAYVEKNIFFVVPKRFASDSFSVSLLIEMLKNEVGNAT